MINTNIVICDFESSHDSEYSLKKMTTEEYVRDKRFETIGLGIKYDGEANASWIKGDHVAGFLAKIDFSQKVVICHNAMFDGAILAWHYDIHPKYLFCTMSMARPMVPAAVTVGLASLAEYFNLGEKGHEVDNALGKRLSDFTPEALRRYGEYCKNDVVLTELLFKRLMESGFPKHELVIVSDVIKCFTEPAIVLDKKILRESLEEIRIKRENLLYQVNPDLEKAIKMIRSDMLFADMLRMHNIEPPVKKNKDGVEKYAFAKTDLKFLELEEHENEDVQILVSTRLDAKSTQAFTRTERFLGIAERGLMPFPLSYCAASTHRLGGADKVNMQNLKRSTPTRKEPLRMALQALPGYTFVVGDSAQIEPRGLAWISGQEDLLQDFRNKVDTYCTLASEIYGRVVTKKDTLERFVGKTARLGLGYGTGKDKFQNTLRLGNGGVKVDLPIDQCERIVYLYRDKHPYITGFWDDCTTALWRMLNDEPYEFGVNKCLQVRGKSILMPNGMSLQYSELRREPDEDGRDQFVYDRRSERTGRVEKTKIYGAKLTENIVQSLSGAILRYQWSLIRRQLKVVGTVHDEIIASAIKIRAQEGVTFMEDCMREIPAWAKGWPVDCEVGSADRYGDAK